MLAVDYPTICRAYISAGVPRARRNPVLLVSELLAELTGNPAESTPAMEAINDFTRVRMREDGFFRRIMPPVVLTDEELDRVPDEYR